MFNVTDIASTWLKGMNVYPFDVSSDSLTEATITTENGAWHVIVEDIEHRYNTLLTVTAISSFVWNYQMPYILDCYNRILPYITVTQWGWLYQNKYDIIFKTIKDRRTGISLIVGYQAKILQQSSFVKFLENCCSMVLREQWVLDTRNNSVLFLVPLANPFVAEALIMKDYFLRKEGAIFGSQQSVQF